MNSDVKFGARKDTRDVETLSKSSGVNLSVRIKSEALDRAKQGVDSVNQIKSGDILGGLNQEQYFIPNSRKFGKVIKSHPIK